ASVRPASRRNPKPKRDSAMLTGVENCWRTALAERADEARAKVGSRSTIVTSPAEPGIDLRKYATALPMAPPPMMTTRVLKARNSENATVYGHVARSGPARQDLGTRSNLDMGPIGESMTADIAVIGGLRDGLVARLKEAYRAHLVPPGNDPAA